MSAQALRRAAQQINGLSLRERVMIFVSVLVAVLLGWYQFAMTPVLKSEHATIESINAARERIEAADTALRAQSEAMNLRADLPFEAQLRQARARVQEVDALISARAVDIVDPATMAKVLEDVLASQKGLRLISAHNLAAQRLAESDDDAPLFRHTLRLELEGPYLAVLAYLEDLEALPWRIYWQGIEIDAQEYPRNRVRIDVSTLSFDEDWIGV